MFTTAQINLFVIDWNKWFLQKKKSSFFNKSIFITLRKLQKKLCETFTTLIVASQSRLKT